MSLKMSLRNSFFPPFRAGEKRHFLCVPLRTESVTRQFLFSLSQKRSLANHCRPPFQKESDSRTRSKKTSSLNWACSFLYLPSAGWRGIFSLESDFTPSLFSLVTKRQQRPPPLSPECPCALRTQFFLLSRRGKRERHCLSFFLETGLRHLACRNGLISTHPFFPPINPDAGTKMTGIPGSTFDFSM